MTEKLLSRRPAVPARWLMILILLFGAARLVWLSDTSFLFDEALLLQRAVDDNLHHAFTTYGIRGTRGIDYGPLAIWFYRGLLTLKADVVFLVVARTVIVTALTAAALLWLVSTCNFLVPEVALIPFLSPYLWYWARNPWDNNLLIPLVALALASYLAFQQKAERWKLAVTLASLTGCFLLHMMSLPLIGAIVLHLVLFHRRWLRRHWRWVTLASSGALALTAPYLVHLSHLAVAGVGETGAVHAVGFSFYGPAELSALGFERYLGPYWFATGPFEVVLPSTVAIMLTGLAFAFCWWGLAIAVSTVWRGRRSPADRAGPRYHLCLLIAIGFALHLATNVMMHVSGAANYYNGVWVLFFAMMWIAASEAWPRPLVRRVFRIYATCLAISLLLIAVRLHQHGGSREVSYGPTLANWIQLARRTPAGAVVRADAFHPSVFPSIIPTLQRLYPPEVVGNEVILRYVRPDDPWDGRIEAVIPDASRVSGVGNQPYGVRYFLNQPSDSFHQSR